MLVVLLKRYFNDLFETLGESNVSRVIRIRKEQLLQVETLKIEDSSSVAGGELFNTSRRIKNIDLCELPKNESTTATKYDFSHVKYLGKQQFLIFLVFFNFHKLT